MDWVSGINLFISIGTFIIVIINIFIDNKQRKIDRQIDVIIGERRRMQQELFKSVINILEIYRQLEYNKNLKENDILFHEILNYRVSIWINLNRENSFSKELRSNCNQLSIWIASALEEQNADNIQSFIATANDNRNQIWILIDKYIEEEERLIQLILNGKLKN
ncbi:hypothetical protein [uncultured Clostridium sp.]|uniref:hypothetical protein n=1 Tax=uncultured Clostridium sp. TaxID=59620 RepID=UPI0027DE4131|nr:hypothetical protein [uncultured Clostridium sp.]